MTEDEKQMDPAFLRGRIDALEAILSAIIDLLPNRGLRALENRMGFELGFIQKAKEADPGHINWDRWERSRYPKNRPPRITLHAEGYKQTIQPILDCIPDIRDEREEGACFAILASSKASDEADESDRKWEITQEDTGA